MKIEYIKLPLLLDAVAEAKETLMVNNQRQYWVKKTDNGWDLTQRKGSDSFIIHADSWEEDVKWNGIEDVDYLF